jgi:hypothetical protein
MLRVTQTLCSNSASAAARSGTGSSAMLILAPQRKPTTAETKSAMQAVQRSRTRVRKFTAGIVASLKAVHELCRSRRSAGPSPGKNLEGQRQNPKFSYAGRGARRSVFIRPLVFSGEELFDVLQAVSQSILREAFKEHAAVALPMDSIVQQNQHTAIVKRTN